MSVLEKKGREDFCCIKEAQGDVWMSVEMSTLKKWTKMTDDVL